MSQLTHVQIVILAKEVLAGKTRSYVSAAHAFAEYIVDCEAETRILVSDDITDRAPAITLPLPFPDPSPSPPDSEEVQPWDAAGKRILDLEPKTHPRLVREPATGMRNALPATKTGGVVVACAAHDVRDCVICNRGGAAE